ncbi:MAG: BrnT family toxin [Burkholderiaceae bacterium]|nr:BrnT family toxin [Burkholderiaceae bacterium]
MLVTVDPSKSERNESERGLPFALAKESDWRSALVSEDSRRDYGERRFQAVGFIEQHLHVLDFTPRGSGVHVISLRRANRRERNRYAAQTAP